MTLRPGLFVSGAAGGVTQPQDARLALAGLLSGVGVLTGGAVAGSTSGPNMKYTVAAGVFVTARGAAATDGLYEFANDGPVTVDSGNFPNGGPAPNSGTRWDLIWVRAKNAYGSDGFGDGDSLPEFGVTCGSSGSSPTKPYASVPAGALVLAEANVGTGIANASLATITQVAPAAGARTNPMRAQYTQQAPTSMPNGSYATIYPFVKDIDTIGLAQATGVFTFPTGSAGQYEISGRVGIDYPGGTSVLCGAKIRRNGSDLATEVGTPAASGSKVAFHFTPIEITIADGDTVDIQVFIGASGQNTSITSGYKSFLRVKRIG